MKDKFLKKSLSKNFGNDQERRTALISPRLGCVSHSISARLRVSNLNAYLAYNRLRRPADGRWTSQCYVLPRQVSHCSLTPREGRLGWPGWTQEPRFGVRATIPLQVPVRGGALASSRQKRRPDIKDAIINCGKERGFPCPCGVVHRFGVLRERCPVSIPSNHKCGNVQKRRKCFLPECRIHAYDNVLVLQHNRRLLGAAAVIMEYRTSGEVPS